jgi:hypothetical protein
MERRSDQDMISLVLTMIQQQQMQQQPQHMQQQQQMQFMNVAAKKSAIWSSST